MLISVTVRYDFESASTLWFLPESPYVHLKQADFFTFLTTNFCLLKLSYSSDSLNTDYYYNNEQGTMW